MEAIIFIGRLLFSAIFVGSGIGHLAQTDQTAATAEAAGLPNPRVMAQVSGVAFLLGGIAHAKNLVEVSVQIQSSRSSRRR